MATNYSLAQARAEINKGNKEAILDFGRRFPLATVLLSKIGKNEAVDELLNALPEHVTIRKIESVLKDGVNISDVDDEDEAVPVEEVEEEKKPAKKEAKKEPVKKEAKKEDKKPAKKAAKNDPIPEPIEEDDEEEEGTDYSEMNAVDLFKLCKKRGIKAEPKKKAAEYIKLLQAADNASDDSEEEEEDDWDI